MGTSAFDAAWGTDTPHTGDAVDALWDAPAAPHHDYHAEFKSGALQKRMAGANARELVSAKEGDAAAPSRGEMMATNALSVGQGIPGVEAVEAAAGALGSHATSHPMSYTESLKTLRGNTDQIGSKARTVQKILGSAAVLPFLPASPVAAGAIMGAADPLLDADPTHGLARRALGATAGAAGGALLGRLGESVVTGARALGTKGVAANLIDRQLARAEQAKEMYTASLNGNRGAPIPDQVRGFLAHEDIAPIVDKLEGVLNVPRESPEMLDAVYKTLSDQAQQIKKGLAQVDPTKPNIGRFMGEHVASLKAKLVKAASQPGTRAVTTQEPTTALEVATEQVPATAQYRVPRTVDSPTTAQSPAPSLRDALDSFDRVKGVAAQRAEGTAEQQLATRALERHHAEGSVPPITGAPGPRTFDETIALPHTKTQITTRVVPTTKAVTKVEPAAPPLPGYGDVVERYAEHSSGLDAVKRGLEAKATEQAGGIPSVKRLLKSSPEALQQWARTASPADKAAAVEGILGGTKMTMGASPLAVAKRSLAGDPFGVAGTPGLLRRVGDSGQATADQVLKILLSSGAAAAQ